MRHFIAFSSLILLSACATAPTATRPAVPEGTKLMSEGYPYPNGPCRLLGATLPTSELLDDGADLLGCPSDAMSDPRVLAVGRVVGQFEGVVLVSVPKAASR
ncbi:MAG: hypothetical protein EON91_09490 [Brevundimonas sp.]|uniref:hypothetical protein n=1 Tax=Brevundimonas sp. TaxID=1871086 RepID=UPI001200B00F|nr:hypothetical protein [Brevundimonas sp.]RZJ17414.1 MAG: hypothetical protein EON91_09490 [Brevundimonas sp.]